MKTKLLKLTEIVTTAGTQIRAKIDTDTVDQYAEAMQDATNKFPPVVVFHDGSQFILADGFHRVMAASRNGFLDIEADVQKGTRADALKFALGANATHGLKRTNPDKHRSVELALAEWPKMADRELAKICAVSHELVGVVRAQLSESDSSLNPPTRIGADGKERKLPTRKQPEPETEPAAQDEASNPPDDSEAERPAVQAANLEDYRDHGQKRDQDYETFSNRIEAAVADYCNYGIPSEFGQSIAFFESQLKRLKLKAQELKRKELES